jgi:DUF4097 and DUF4098 domain-containing protein YvlB
MVAKFAVVLDARHESHARKPRTGSSAIALPQRVSAMKHFALFLVLVGFTLGASAGNEDLNIDKVNGGIHVPDAATVGKLSTVNGGIHIGANAQAKTVDTVNGSIEVGRGARAVSLHSVNGAIRVAAEAHVEQTITTVNGSIALGANVEVGGKVSNVNGNITLDHAHVGGGIETGSGDIEVGADSRVEGGIQVDADRSWFGFGIGRKPRIVIGPGAIVQGTLRFQREVEL